MKIRKITASFLAVAAMLLISPIKSFAIPTLQLDIAGGTYDPYSETIVASDYQFTLYALIIPDAGNMLSDTYYISAALSPQVNSSSSLGSFIFNGTTVNATSDMDYGTPPVEANLAAQPGDLQKHGVFPTYFKEFGFQFSSANRINSYNTADRATAGTAIDLTPASSGDMYYAAFTVDTALLDPEYNVHFDLYNTATDGSNVYVTQFAPFSHDAESYHVPEPSTLVLLGSSMIGFAVIRRKFRVRV